MGDSRQNFPRGIPRRRAADPGAAMREASENARSRAAAANTGKKHKAEVRYKSSYANKRKSVKCGNCVHGQFVVGSAQGACELVAGPIAYDGVCDLWKSADGDDAKSEASESPKEQAAEKAVGVE